jgi:hypothetical protein
MDILWSHDLIYTVCLQESEHALVYLGNVKRNTIPA